MTPIDLLVLPRWLLPIEPAGPAREGWALAVHQGRIAAVLPRGEALASFQAAEVLSLDTHVVMPGLVNVHTHSAMTLLRGLADDLPLMDWLQNHIWPAEAAHVGEAFCRDGVALACAEMIRGGQTCFNDMYFFPEATVAAAEAAGLRLSVGLIVLDFPTAYAQPGEYLAKGLALHDAVKRRPRVSTLFAPHAPYSVSDAPLREIRKYADELGIGIHMHVHETAGEVAMAQQQDGRRPWQRLAALELLGAGFLAVHMTQLTPGEIAEAARLGVSVAHCPHSNLKLASGLCPLAELLEAGVTVGLGTDGAASNNALDLWAEARTAGLLAKGVGGDARAVDAARLLRLLTLDGARALGLDEQIGSLQAGKAADFIAVDLAAANSWPVYDPVSHLAYAVNSRQVSHSYVEGRCLLRDGQLQTLDETALRAAAAGWAARIRPDGVHA
ncbi:MAG TPA: TRZ/ATZ family hydrolase [Nevskiaceae bacterium]|nr:TRZ/ATZ family hydrolase [Nevskiaceae bacterium]